MSGAHLRALGDDAVLGGDLLAQIVGPLALISLVISEIGLSFSEDGEEHGEQDEDGDEEVCQVEGRVHVVWRVLNDRVDVEVAEERAPQRDERVGL